MKRFFGEARTQILLWYLLLFLGFVAIALPLMRYFIFAKVNERVRKDLFEEVKDFQALMAGQLTPSDRVTIRRMREDGRPDFTLRPQTPREVEGVFEVFFARRVPEDDTFLIGIVDQKYYKSSPRALPDKLQPGKPLMLRWQSMTQLPQTEPEISDSTIQGVLYIAEPIEVDGKTVGMLVVAHTAEGERKEALEALIVVMEVIGLALVLVLLAAWWVSGRVLAPLRGLVKTAHQISESDLTARIPVVGDGEIADLAKTFNEMMDRVEESFATQRMFINDAGHELRTPITIIQGNLEVMGDDPADRQETLVLVMDELDRMARMVDDLMMLAKSERPDFLRPEIVDIAAFTEELLAKVKALGDRTWHLDAAALGSVILDRQRITEAVINLAQNAVQHTAVGQIIAIGSAMDRTHLRLWVRDRGEGIAPNDQVRIFERFARAAKTRRKSDGAGLGLSIVRAIAEAHHGTIALHSHVARGSTFTLILPIRPLPSTLARRP
ncbi:sensor histidine kinase [Myxacorys almedinensis]|uniref:sensor histidine kinase n=1 Tax=Myxacorys almedinensis TaxID=2651157 RepID=UPI001EE40F24|nr:HAMP domain-containing sensor histidine kinase [Myxacorys almedinensis]